MEFGKNLQNLFESFLDEKLRQTFPPGTKTQLFKSSVPLVSDDGRLGWIVSTLVLKEAYRLLILYGFISANYSDFQLLFFGVGTARRIKWLKSTQSLPYFFDELIAAEYITKHPTLFKLLSGKFIDKEGKIPNANSLRSSFNSIKHDQEDGASVDALYIKDIIEQLETFKPKSKVNPIVK
jgi:hypothetical protein